MSTLQNTLLRHLHSLAGKQASGALSDQHLLESFLIQRSETSFAALVRRHGPMVLSVCRRVLHNHHDAEDAFQATFLVFVRKAASMRKQESLGSFLHGIAYHVASKLKLAASRRAARERTQARVPFSEPCDDLTWRELRSVLDEELAKLPEQQRAPLVMCYLEGKTQDEAAQLLGWSKSTFRRRLDQARDALGRRLTRRGVTLSAALSVPLLADAGAQAALPPLLAASTVRAGLGSAMGLATGTLVSAQVTALVEGGTGTLLAKKASVIFVLLLSLTLGVGGLLAHRTAHSRTLAEAPAAPKLAQPALLSPPARSASKDQAIEIKGRVLNPDGKPLAGACVFLLPKGNPKKADVPVRATTDKAGRFRFTARPVDFGTQGKGVLAATAKGFGLDWIDLDAKTKGEEIALRLVADDVPIVGRVLDLEGRPIAEATVQVLTVTKRADGKDLAAFVEKLEKYLKDGTPAFPNKNFQPGPLGVAWDQFQWKRIRPTGLDVSATVTTGKDGSFRLTGFGRERVLELAIHGSTIAQTELQALTRIGPPNGWIRGHFGLYGCRLDYLAAPCKPIVGTVRDKRTGKPLAGITVGVCQEMISESKSDSQGHYRIIGAAKSKEYEVDAGGMPYFNHAKRHIADTPGLEPLTVDFELERGIIVRGRLTEKSTGKPVQGEVYYKAAPDNPHLKDYVDVENGAGVALDLQGRTAPDGSFTVLAIPGPGLLHIQADDVNRFVRAEVKGGALQFHAEVRINPSESDPKSTTCDIALEPGRVLNGSVLGPDGKPLAGVYAAGRWPIFSHGLMLQERLQDDSFLVGGLKAGHPRTLVFLHPEKKLGKVVKLQGGETESLLVHLEPLNAALTGRILDAKGGPWPGLKVTVRTLLGGDVFRDKSYPPEFLWGYSAWQNLDRLNATTDCDGRFRIAGLMPGLKYVLFAYEESAPQGTPFAYHDDKLIVTIESGETKDLGDLKSKRTPEK